MMGILSMAWSWVPSSDQLHMKNLSLVGKEWERVGACKVLWRAPTWEVGRRSRWHWALGNTARDQGGRVPESVHACGQRVGQEWTLPPVFVNTQLSEIWAGDTWMEVDREARPAKRSFGRMWVNRGGQWYNLRNLALNMSRETGWCLGELGPRGACYVSYGR